ncbi:unnamed protein product [Gadus morhua 'NCC']
MPPLFMDAKSSSSGFTSGEDLDSSNSGLREGDDAAGPPAPRRRGAGGGQRKGKNRDAARKSRMKQTAKADELHKEHQYLERSNTTLEKEIAALRAEVKRYTVVLERHQPSCTLLAAGRSEASRLPSASASTPASTPTPTPPSITAASLQRGSSRPSETPCSPAGSDPSGASDSPDRPRVSDAMPCSHWGLASSQPAHRPLPSFGAPSHRLATSGPGDPAAPSAFALSTPVQTTSSLSDPGQLGGGGDSSSSSSSSSSFSSSSSSSSSSSILHLLSSHPLPPPASSRVTPASFAPLRPAPGPNLHFRSERESSATSAVADAVLPPLSQGQGGPAPFYPYLGYPIHGYPGSSSVHGYQTDSPGALFPTPSSGHGPYRGFAPGNLLLPPDILDHLDVLLPTVSMGTHTPVPPFSELMPALWDLSGDTALSQLLQTDDWNQDC